MTAAFRAVYSDMKLVKTRQVAQLIFEIPIENFDAAYEVLGGMPVPSKERWFGIAAIKSPAEEAPSDVPSGSPPSTRPDGTKRQKIDWRELQPAAQAALRCDQPAFHAFLRGEHHYTHVIDADSAASAVRHICVVKSRSEFSTDHRKRVLWKQLDDQFSAWLAKERVGA